MYSVHFLSLVSWHTDTPSYNTNQLCLYTFLIKIWSGCLPGIIGVTALIKFTLQKTCSKSWKRYLTIFIYRLNNVNNKISVNWAVIVNILMIFLTFFHAVPSRAFENRNKEIEKYVLLLSSPCTCKSQYPCPIKSKVQSSIKNWHYIITLAQSQSRAWPYRLQV